jgi:hypothetical protein
VTKYFDWLAGQNGWALGFEIETSSRHGVDNAIKAAAVGVPLWIIVPSGRVKKQLLRKLKPLNLQPSGEPIQILLLGQLHEYLEKYMSLRALANTQTRADAADKPKGGNQP